MHKGLVASRFIHVLASVAVVAGPVTGYALAATNPPAKKLVRGQGDSQNGDSKPPAYPKRFHHAADGKLYVPAGTPVRLSIELTAPGGTTHAPQHSPEISDESSVTLKEGPTTLEFGEARIPVTVDGTAPKTVLEVGDTSKAEQGGLRVLAARPKLHLTATDNLSGVARTMVSLDGAPFVLLPAGGPVFTAEGIHHLRYFSVDNVGNAEQVHEYVFRLDATPPKTLLAISGPHTDNVVGVGASFTLTANDAFAGVDNIQYQLDGATLQAYEKPIQLDDLPEGPHRLQFLSEDKDGNKERPQTFAFVVDRQPPDIALAITGPLFTNKGVRYVSPQSDIKLSSEDVVSGSLPVRYRVDGKATEMPYDSPFRLPASTGIHRLNLDSIDPVNNLAQVAVTDIYVDLTPPQTTVEYSRPFFERDGDVVLNPQSQIALNASDFESGVDSISYSLDGGPEQKYTAPFAVATEGAHTLSLAATDHVGNHETAQLVHLFIQKPASGVAPTQALDTKRWYLDPDKGLIGPTGLPFELKIAVSQLDDAETFRVTPGKASTENPGPLTFVVPGQNKLKVAIGPKNLGVAVGIDAAPPKTTLTATGAQRADLGGVTYFGPGLNISLASVDDPAPVSSGVWKTLFSLDGSAFGTYTTPLKTFTREGAYTLRYYGLDNVGNPETPHTFQFTIDTSAPVTTLELRGPNRGSAVSPATEAVLTAKDNLAGVAQTRYRIDQGDTGFYNKPLAIGRLSDGQHHLRYFSTDPVGNKEEEHNWQFSVESKVSAASYTFKGVSVEHGGTIYAAPGGQIFLKAAEGYVIQYSLDGQAPQTYKMAIHLPDNGSHRLTFHASDDLGNVSATGTVNVIVDRTAPVSHAHLEGTKFTRDGTVIIGGSTRVVLDASAGAVGGAKLEYSINGRGWQPYNGPFTIKSSGPVELSYRARNAIQTVEPVQKEHFIVDAQGPIIGVHFSGQVDASAGTVALLPGAVMFITAEDSPAGLDKLTYKIDDQPPLIYRSPLSGFVPGVVHTVTIVAEDLLGNKSEKVVHLRVKERAR